MPADAGTPPEPTGPIADLLKLFGSISGHFQALAALASAETREAATLYLKLLIVLVAALCLAALGYIFLLFFIAFAAARLFGVEWIWITLALAALHLIGAVVCALHVRRHGRTPVFALTAREVKKDLDAFSRSQP
jgi:uncharacterized membrane protein YqjE